MDRIPKGTKVRDQFGNVGELTDDYVGKSTAWIRVAGKRTEAHSSKVFLMDGRSLTEAIGANRDLMSKQPDTEGLAELLSASSSPAERAILMQRAAPKMAMASDPSSKAEARYNQAVKDWNAASKRMEVAENNKNQAAAKAQQEQKRHIQEQAQWANSPQAKGASWKDIEKATKASQKALKKAQDELDAAYSEYDAARKAYQEKQAAKEKAQAEFWTAKIQSKQSMHAGQPQVAMAINPEDREQARNAQQQKLAREAVVRSVETLQRVLPHIVDAVQKDNMPDAADLVNRLGGLVDAIDRRMAQVDY